MCVLICFPLDLARGSIDPLAISSFTTLKGESSMSFELIMQCGAEARECVSHDYAKGPKATRLTSVGIEIEQDNNTVFIDIDSLPELVKWLEAVQKPEGQKTP